MNVNFHFWQSIIDAQRHASTHSLPSTGWWERHFVKAKKRFAHDQHIPPPPFTFSTAQMPICIECRHPVKTLWTKYSGAGDKSSGHNIRLTVCRKCGRFCDKYVEHDFVVLFIDLVLIKPQVSFSLEGDTKHSFIYIYLQWLAQVYRHLLHNTLMRDDDRLDVCFTPSHTQLFVLLHLLTISSLPLSAWVCYFYSLMFT